MSHSVQSDSGAPEPELTEALPLPARPGPLVASQTAPNPPRRTRHNHQSLAVPSSRLHLHACVCARACLYACVSKCLCVRARLGVCATTPRPPAALASERVKSRGSFRPTPRPPPRVTRLPKGQHRPMISCDHHRIAIIILTHAVCSHHTCPWYSTPLG